MSKDDCDYQFLQDMQAQCQPDNIVDLVLKSGDNFAACGTVAMEFYLAVQRYGAQRYNTNPSTYCEYDGPP